MKKITLLLAASLAFFACNKESNDLISSKNPISLKADIENITTKATLDGVTLAWANDDIIGLAVSNESGTWYTNQECTTSDSGSSVDFTSTVTYSDSDKWNFAAFFPYKVANGWDSKSNSYTYSYNYLYAGDNHAGNAANGTMRFYLPEGIYNYQSGQLLVPMMADLSGDNTHPTDMHFKYLGGAVKVVFNNLPAGVHSLGMTVDGQKVFGSYENIDPKQAGTAVLAQENSTTANTVWINFDSEWKNSRTFTFIIPVPELNTPKFSFQMWDDNEVCGWRVSLKAQNVDVKRGEVLVMPNVVVNNYNYYDGFNASDIWDVCGSFTDSFNNYISMREKGDWFVAENVVLSVGDKFKVRLNHGWTEAYPSDDYYVNEAGTYDIIFNQVTHAIKLVKDGAFPSLK